MTRCLLPILGTLVLCAQPFSAWAADSTSSRSDTSTYEYIREQTEAKREALAGVNHVAKATPESILDAPVKTDDAPSQEQQP